MKKWIALIMGAVLCFSLVACGRGIQTNSNGVQQADKFAHREDSVYSVFIKINPEFEIYINEKGKITTVDYLNEDARKVFAQIEVVNMDFESGFRKLLDAAYENGYMNGNSVQISVSTYKAANADIDDAIVMDGIARVTEKFSSSTGVGLSVSMEAFVVIGETNKQDSVTQEGEQQVQQKQELQSEQEAQSEQQIPQDEPQKQQEQQIQPEVENNGTYVAEGTFSDGSFKEYYENNILLKRETTLKDGAYVEETFDQNGNMIQEVRNQADGYHSEVVFDAKGKVLSVIVVNAEGVREESNFEYYENGNKKMQHSISNEVEHTITFYERGSKDTDIQVRSDGGRFEERFAENGTLLYSYDLKPGGDYVKRSYNADGILLTKENSINGEVSVMTYRTDGTASEEYVYCVDGTVWYNVFDANGHQILEASKQIK